MLSTLSVRNFAIINNISIDFKHGLTVLTGETGAGKSLIIDAISLLLGERASSDMVRHGEDKAVIEGVFYHQSKAIDELLSEYGIDALDGNMLMIKREIQASGKSVSRINGSLVTLNQLLEVAGRLADIHTQLDTKKLFDSKNYLTFIDDGQSQEKITEYKLLHRNYRQTLKDYNDLVASKNKDVEQTEYLKFQIQELDKASLRSGEVEELESELKFLNNFETIHNHMTEAVSNFQENNLIHQLYQLKSALEKLSRIDPKYSNYVRIAEDSYYQLDDLSSTIAYDLNSLEFDSTRLEQINARMAFLSDLKRKHRKTVDEMIRHLEELKHKVSIIENYDDVIEEKHKDVLRSYHDLKNASIELSEHRKKLAKVLEEKIKTNLIDLQLPKTQFEIRFSTPLLNNPLQSGVFLNDGVDSVSFFISLNIGEPLKELSKTASGGEMSRFMLALKTIFSRNYGLSTMIFDEIDAGVSGNVAFSIANKLKDIAETTQVLCITHLPQVAGMADYHLKISKRSEAGRTEAFVNELSYEEKVMEIAAMISNDQVTTSSVALSKELIQQKKEKA